MFGKLVTGRTQMKWGGCHFFIYKMSKNSKSTTSVKQPGSYDILVCRVQNLRDPKSVGSKLLKKRLRRSKI